MVNAAARAERRRWRAGQIGQQPARPGQQTQITLSTLGRLKEPEQFGNIILRTTPDGRITRHQRRRPRRAGREERGRQLQARRQAVGRAWSSSSCPTPTPWTWPTASTRKWTSWPRTFPTDLIYEIQYDTTPYTRECIHEVFKALRDAIILVAFVVLVFLQNWRSAIIPLIAVPVAIIGTFAVMAVMGFSLNNLTLFGLVLAIGIVVDDAIVVVEAVEHHIEHGLAPREATIKAMSQVSAPGDRRGPGPQRGVRALRVHQRHHGPVLPAVRPDDRRLDDHLDLQLADAQPGAVGRAAAAARPRTRTRSCRGCSIALAGGWLGYQWLTPWLASLDGTAVPRLPARLSAALGRRPGGSPPRWRSWRWPRSAGWSAGPVNFAPGLALRGFQRGLRRSTTAYTRAVGGCCASARWCWWSTAACCC